MSEPMYFYDEFKALVDTLNAEGIEYAVCGGIAVAFYGYARLTRDFDVLIHEVDIERVSRAVKKLGFLFDAGRIPFGVGGPNHREIYRISKIVDDTVLTLDLLLVAGAYQPVWESRGVVLWENRQVQVVSLEGLLAMKRIAGRAKDLLDIEMLTTGGDSGDG